MTRNRVQAPQGKSKKIKNRRRKPRKQYAAPNYLIFCTVLLLYPQHPIPRYSRFTCNMKRLCDFEVNLILSPNSSLVPRCSYLNTRQNLQMSVHQSVHVYQSLYPRGTSSVTGPQLSRRASLLRDRGAAITSFAHFQKRWIYFWRSVRLENYRCHISCVLASVDTHYHDDESQ